MRQPVVPPSSSVDVPLTGQRARKRESGRHVTRRRPHSFSRETTRDFKI
jgi:hypothetical protein